MNKKRALSLFLLLCLALLAFASCGSNTTEGKLKKQFDKMYSAFNKGDYETYASYFKLDEEIVSNMKQSFELTASVFDIRYKLDDVEVYADTEDLVVAEVAALNTTCVLADNITRVTREHITYTFSVEDGVYYITGFELGPTDLVDVPDVDRETISDEELYGKIIEGLESADAESTSAE